MKQAEVKVGEQYLTKVSGGLRRVIVVEAVSRPGYGNDRSYTRFLLAYPLPGAGNSKPLPRARPASALRPCPAPKTS